MAKLTTKKRNSLPKSDFALPGKRKYPVNNKSHAENALARSANKSPAVKAAVARKVHEKFPGMGSGAKRPNKGKQMSMKAGHHKAITEQTGYTL